ncbi:MAG: sialidase family protein, partial [Actinomycetota bacterium]
SGKKGPPPRPGNLNIFLAVSNDDGKTFSYPIRVNDDPAGPEHRFPIAVTDAKGALFVAWLDKRKGTPENPGFSRVYVTRSTDGGKTFSPNVDATKGQRYGICHCCRLALVTHPREGLVVAFRNDVDNMRDIFLVRSTDQGATFSAPAPIEEYRWTIPACPFNGPSLAFDAAGNLHMTWMTGGNAAGKPLLGASTGATYKVMYRRMEAVSRNWSDPICLAEGTHPKLLLTSDGSPVIAWDGDGIQVTRLPRTGAGRPELLRLTPPTREYAFPALVETSDKGLIVTWQKTDERGKTQLFTSRLTTGGASAGLTAKTPRAPR